jgi:hypothetical protein
VDTDVVGLVISDECVPVAKVSDAQPGDLMLVQSENYIDRVASKLSGVEASS